MTGVGSHNRQGRWSHLHCNQRPVLVVRCLDGISGRGVHPGPDQAATGSTGTGASVLVGNADLIVAVRMHAWVAVGGDAMSRDAARSRPATSITPGSRLADDRDFPALVPVVHRCASAEECMERIRADGLVRKWPDDHAGRHVAPPTLDACP